MIMIVCVTHIDSALPWSDGMAMAYVFFLLCSNVIVINDVAYCVVRIMFWLGYRGSIGGGVDSSIDSIRESVIPKYVLREKGNSQTLFRCFRLVNS